MLLHLLKHYKEKNCNIKKYKVQNGGFNPLFQTFFIRDIMTAVTIVFKVHSCLFRII